ncbi:hypothetical protein C4D60_Mb05t00260 [Musa balbisiana]|uniref:Uncharacterized protein n=1 Tax=Musa balbisiana TaxID=52838 RepID=A0A4S8JSM5_MUSBA|nr:hypothetical protein C4D60_Mb05t00260 [Musa balbisiana]
MNIDTKATPKMNLKVMAPERSGATCAFGLTVAVFVSWWTLSLLFLLFLLDNVDVSSPRSLDFTSIASCISACEVSSLTEDSNSSSSAFILLLELSSSADNPTIDV